MTPVRTVLHPTDFSDASAAALRVARSLARDHGARLIVLHVAPAGAVYGTIPVPLDLQPHQDSLEVIREVIGGTDLKYPVETRLRLGHAAAEILRAAEEVGADLIVMGTHGRTGLRRLLTGSVAEAVLRRARCPVLIVSSPTAGPDPGSDQTPVELAAVP
jgi:nucleotide-binding universal stress UspA family protein